MKWKNVLLGGTFLGVLTLGAMFSPIGKPTATTSDQVSAENLSVVQTATENQTPQKGEDSYSCPMTGAPMGNGARMDGYFAGSMPKVIADALGMSVDELQAARSEGKSVADLAKEKGVKVDDLLDKMITSRKADLNQLVKDGKMTQEQLDAMLKNMKVMMKTAIERNTIGPMNGSGNRHMGMGQSGRI